MDWSKITFKYSKTKTVLTSLYQDGKWGKVKSQNEDKISIAVFSPSFHYGMSCFEGLKAFRGADGKVRVFRPYENAKRLQSSAKFLGIPCPDEDLFVEMCMRSVRENIDFLPPYESRASLYLRPILITTIPSINLVPQQDGILFMVIALPVGNYGTGTLTPIKTVIARDYDRAAPHGSGSYKVGGNYAASMFADGEAVKMGYKDVLYLNPGEYKYIDEFSSANFFGIKGNEYATPLSKSVLPSITNKSLQQIASDDFGMNVQKRKITLEELSDFMEVGECGTAVVITPVSSIDDKETLAADKIIRQYKYDFSDMKGTTCSRLYNALTGIQFGEQKDIHGWCLEP